MFCLGSTQFSVMEKKKKKKESVYVVLGIFL